jgi:O-antigen ligase
MSGVALAFSRAAQHAPQPRPAAAVLPLHVAPVAQTGRHVLLIGGMTWLLTVLMIAPEGFDYSLVTAAFAPEAGGLTSRLMWLALLGCGIVVVLRRARRAATLLRYVNPFLLAFTVLVALSLIWSIEPEVTLRRLMRVVIMLLVAIGVALMGWHRLRFQNLLRPIVTIVLAASIVFGLVLPEYAIHQETSGVLAGAWHGISSHKNGLGDLACVGLIFWTHAWLAREQAAPRALLGAAVAVTCLILSRSSTALMGAMFALLFLVLLLRLPRALQRYMPYLVIAFIAVLIAYAIAMLQILPGSAALLKPIGALTGKDMTFTGRTMIWAVMTDHVRQHPLLGIGYGAYWVVPTPGKASYDYIQRLHFYPGSAHNGYLDIINDLGAVGGIVLLGFLIVFVAQALRLLRSDRAMGALLLALFLHQAIANLSESRWLSVFSVDFVVMTLATVCMGRALWEQDRGRATAAVFAAARAMPAPSARAGPVEVPS